MSAPTTRALRAAALRVAEAHRARADAIVEAHRHGGAIGDIAVATGLDAFTVRDVLAAHGAVESLRPKETVRRGPAGR